MKRFALRCTQLLVPVWALGGCLENPNSASNAASQVSPHQVKGSTSTETFSDDEIPTLDESRIAGLSAATLAQLPPHQLKRLTASQMAALQPHQMGQLGSAVIQAWAQHDSWASLQALSSASLASIPAASWRGLKGLTPLEQYSALRVDQYEALKSPAQNHLPSFLNNLYGHRNDLATLPPSWSSERIRALTPERIARLKFDRTSKTDTSELFLHGEVFSAEQLRAIPLDYIRLFWAIPALSEVQLRAFLPEQIGRFSSAQLNLLSAEQVRWLSHDQLLAINEHVSVVRGLHASFVTSLYPEYAPESGHYHLPRTPDVAPGTESEAPTTDEFLYSTLLEGLQDPAAVELGRLKTKAVLVHLDALPLEVVRGLNASQMSLLGRADFKHLSPARFGQLDPNQIPTIHYEAIPGLTGAHLSASSPEQVAKFLPEQLNAYCYRDHRDGLAAIFPVEHTAFFKPDQIAAVHPFLAPQFFTPARIARLSYEQLEAIRDEQLEALRTHPVVKQALLTRADALSVGQQRVLEFHVD